MNATRNLITAIGGGRQAPTMYKFLHKFGRDMSVTYDKELTGSMPLGACFRNSAQVCVAEGFDYCEGMALSKGLIPMEHAWVRDGDQFVDPTWSAGVEYVGVVFDPDWLRKHLLNTGVYGVFGSLHRLRKPPSWVWGYLKEGLYA